MSNAANLDQRRRAALDEVKKSERLVRYLFYFIAAWELILFVAIIFCMDFGDRLHVLIFLSAGLVYGTLGIGLLALGAYMRQNTQRVLAALELFNNGDG